jgi:hypothetical protein
MIYHFRRTPTGGGDVTRWVADKTLDAAREAIRCTPGISRSELATSIGLRTSSIYHVLTTLRESLEIAPGDVYRAHAGGPTQVEDPVEQRILCRARRGMVCVSALPTELGESVEDVAVALRRLRGRRAIYRPDGLYPLSALHDRGRSIVRMEDT